MSQASLAGCLSADDQSSTSEEAYDEDDQITYARFGGGIGNSGYARCHEAARYFTEHAFFPDSIYDYYDKEDDYKSDILSRGLAINFLKEERAVPFDLALAFHTDAGIADTIIGSLSICTTNDTLPYTYKASSLASSFLTNLQSDLRKYDWKIREARDRNYAETRIPHMPSVILEMLSHQNFQDMKLAYDPYFKFDLCRSIYKTIARFLNPDAIIQPLPVRSFAATIDQKKQKIILSWQSSEDELEPSAMPTGYIVYIREEGGDFDNGTLIKTTSAEIDIIPDKLYSFKICAINDGGKSFDSEILSAGISSQHKGNILIVNAFTRLSAPQTIQTDSLQGFDLDLDIGLPYRSFSGFAGRQLIYDKAAQSRFVDSSVGASASDLAGRTIMGNSFDYAYLHGKGMLQAGYSFASCSQSYFIAQSSLAHSSILKQYDMIDLYTGAQKSFDIRLSTILTSYLNKGGKLLLSGSNLLKSGAFDTDLLKANLAAILYDKSIDQIHGSGLEMSIYRQMNEESYAVPQPEILAAQASAFPFLAYSDNTTAAIAYNGKDYKLILCGFPIESIINDEARNALISASVKFLCK